ncbi:hypothetical protein [Streptomyces griseorubiginosus]|uniref:hypothetical protein n=1 Tax=Streptomyces griseorubiginosus TaxID=67304 RepID=UPI002E7FBB53|nr:hypothetical protein [Streptomyces griseorubiginosus]WUB45974.1 hypothetical protein OHN19_22595 [Streptomyces griseorubiginosus]WUB54495.1 hypothetical protein OG942_22595 [Streptomyces griseorubiginosus]
MVRPRSFAFVGVAAVVPLLVSAVSAQAASGALTVTTLGRHGAKVASTVTVVAVPSGRTYSVASGKRIGLPSGRYIAMTDIFESATDGPGDDTVGAQVVQVSGSTSVTLDARKGKAVKVSLDTPADVTGPPWISAQVCAGTVSDMPSAFSRGGGNYQGSLYAIPNSSKLLQFGYLAQWTGKDSYVAVKNTTGIPAAPGGSYKRANLATMRFSVRAGTQLARANDTSLQAAPRTQDCTTDMMTEVRDDDAPYSVTVHVTPGTWQPRDDIFADNGDDIGGGFPATRTLKAGQSFTQSFGRAAWSPMHYLPTVTRRSVAFIPDALIGDPDVGVNGADPTKETVVLTKGGTTLKKQTLTNWGTSDAEFSAGIRSAGWYDLTVDAHRYRPGITFPAGMLSSRVTLDWHFKADPARSMVAPVFMTRFLPTGLNSHNQAAPSSTTTVDVSAGRGSQGPDLAFTKVTAKSVKVWSSADGGRTWKAATVRHSGSTWQASVHNPGSGAVALRSEVTDAAGDRSVETVYRAYAIG